MITAELEVIKEAETEEITGGVISVGRMVK